MKSLYFVVLVALGLAGCAEAFIESPLETLTPAQRAASINYPPDAKASGTPGVVLLVCEITSSHRLANCEVTYESLPGRGFGVAALRTADSISVHPAMPVGMKVSQIIGFCNTASGCSRMERISGEIRESIRRNRADKGLPLTMEELVPDSSGAEMSE